MASLGELEVLAGCVEYGVDGLLVLFGYLLTCL